MVDNCNALPNGILISGVCYNQQSYGYTGYFNDVIVAGKFDDSYMAWQKDIFKSMAKSLNCPKNLWRRNWGNNYFFLVIWNTCKLYEDYIYANICISVVMNHLVWYIIL